jgi:hypothetical protein
MCQPTPYVGQVGTRAEVRKTSLCLDSLLKLFVLYIFFAQSKNDTFRLRHLFCIICIKILKKLLSENCTN